ATLRDRVCAMAALHRDVSDGATARLAEAAAASEAVAAPARPSDIAVIGMSCILPKAPDVDTFWTNILGKVDAITEVPAHRGHTGGPARRFDGRAYYAPDPGARDKFYSRGGGFTARVPSAPARYGTPPSSIPSIEPLQLLTLEAVRAALEDAGYLERDFRRA